MKGRIRITLKSDLCASSGENYGASIDRDVCFDRQGFPIIPAKRMKGCLRASATELENFGLLEERAIEEIFGIGGGNSGSLILRDATLQNHAELSAEIRNFKYREYLHPQNVLGQYTYVRAQTAIGSDGIAKNGSLRFTRVVKRGTAFLCRFELKDALFPEFKKAVAAFRNMGLNRTRGFGRIKAEIFPDENSNYPSVYPDEAKEEDSVYVLDYTLRLDSDVLFPKAEGGAQRTELFIPGGSVLGFFASRMPKTEHFKELFLDGNLIFQNAFVSDGETRFRPAHAAILKVKDSSADVPRVNALIDAGQTTAGDLSPKRSIGEKFLSDSVGDTAKVMSVRTNILCHYRYPSKKNGDAAFYQYAAIAAGQLFSGRMIGKGKYINKILSYWPDDGAFTLGRSKNAQYGRAEIVKVNTTLLFHKSETASRFVLEFLSPCILMNRNGVFSADLETLQAVLKEKLGVMPKPIRTSLRYKTIGGYNLKWNLPKQQVQAFDVGSVCVFETPEEVDIASLCRGNIGERVSEGYGETVAYPYSRVKPEIRLTEVESNAADSAAESCETGSEIVPKILKNILLNELRQSAYDAVGPLDGKKAPQCITNPTTVGRLALMFRESVGSKESDKIKTFTKNLMSIKDGEKLSECCEALFCLKKPDDVKESSEDAKMDSEKTEEEIRAYLRVCADRTDIASKITGLREQLGIKEEELFMAYVPAFLTQEKYVLRMEKRGYHD